MKDTNWSGPGEKPSGSFPVRDGNPPASPSAPKTDFPGDKPSGSFPKKSGPDPDGGKAGGWDKSVPKGTDFPKGPGSGKD